MTSTALADPAPGADASTWTCPFCSLLCDDLALTAAQPTVPPATCPRASAALAGLKLGDVGPGRAFVQGQPATLDAAITHAAHLLATARQPLFGGLATDVGGARALVKLAGQCGAICDHAAGEPLALATRVLHDQGSWMVTLGEVAARAELVVCVGSDPAARHPRFWQRINVNRSGSPLRKVRFLGLKDDAARAQERLRAAAVTGDAAGAVSLLARDAGGTAGASATARATAISPTTDAMRRDAALDVEALANGADLFDSLQALALALRPRPPASLDPAWLTLAAELRASPYVCFVWEAGVLPRHGELAAGAVQGIVATLNQTTRAGSVALAGGDGAATAQQVHTWLTGLPLRTRLASEPGGRIEHDPIEHGANRLLADHGCDALLWVSSITALAPPAAAADLPTIVLGPPALAPVDGATTPEVFIPVASPGLHHVGHLFRSDGIIAMPMQAPLSSTLPDVADIARRIGAAVATTKVST
ncbi:MAG: formylmethanofuran dehydrogenase, subunit [Pseudomonadota bacterium]|jgi:formylmethanofuran dehydrogenase subunit B